MKWKLLGLNDEPQNSGAVVAVHWGDYRRQEIWVASGANIGAWYCLGGEFGRPKVWVDPRSELEKLDAFWQRDVPEPGPGEVPLHPDWHFVVSRGPVVLLSPGDRGAYEAGWRNGRQHLAGQVEDLAYDDPEGGPGGDGDEQEGEQG
ncbi:hypothetical protein E1091_02945 [Micromonospora fluostatini]|uniref:Uncharacterized protein n=1 Tax=Micromonospora fluostatini TaxID=1629071 RepID=A0ABY2DKP3_9ACTN|nr:hypothetical protein E1091_02945 [Micromonospora fluostatini]